MYLLARDIVAVNYFHVLDYYLFHLRFRVH